MLATDHDQIARAWRRLSGERRTIARGAVIEVLASSDVHLPIAEIHERVAAARPEINLSTVHRTVAFLVERGVAHVLAWPGEARYGLAADPHVHAICDTCTTMIEIPAGPLRAAITSAGRVADFQAGTTALTVSGRCASCRTAQR